METTTEQMHRLRQLFVESDSPVAYAAAYMERVIEVLRCIEAQAVAQTADAFEAAIEQGHNIFLIANGGSAAVAAHTVNDMVAGAHVKGRPPCRVMNLTDNVETITAIANDRGFEDIFLYQLEAMMRPGDLVVAMSVSGNSPNIVRAMEYAREAGGKTVAWTGFDGGRLKDLCEVVVHMPTTKDEYGPVEDIFSILSHAVMTYLTMKRGRNLHH